MEFKIAMGQINPTSSGQDNNTEQIIDCIKKAVDDGSDIIVFPELAITGYCCGSLFEQKSFIENNERILREKIAPLVTDGLVCVIGFAELGEVYSSRDFELFNSCAIIQDGEVLDVYRKQFLANEGHHEDMKYFTPGEDRIETTFGVIHRTLDVDFSLGTLICEDIWHKHDDFVLFNTMRNSDILIVPNHSYFYYGKQTERYELVSGIAKKYKKPVVYLNPVGIGDIVKNVMVYDGGSFIADKYGVITKSIMPSFKAEYRQVDIGGEPRSAFIKPTENKYHSIYQALTYSMREFYKLSGISKAQVHISGGLDSAIGACLSVGAMGADNCVFITNPTKYNGEETKGFAEHICHKLNVNLIWNPTGGIYDEVVKEHVYAFGGDPTPAGKASIQAVLRAVQGLAASHTFGSGMVACGNHTELVLGWASFHDVGSIGMLSLIGDLTKVEVFEFARWMNSFLGEDVIPPALFNGESRPAAELPDSNEDPFDYFVVSGICAEIIRNKKDTDEIVEDFKNKTLTSDYFPIDWDKKSIYEKLTEKEFRDQVEYCYKLSKRSVYKAAQSAPVPIISKVSRGFSSRETLINQYNGKSDFG